MATRVVAAGQARYSAPLLVFLLAPVSSCGQQEGAIPRDDVDRYILEEMEARQIPGLALAVLRDGQVLKMSGYGVASVELAVPVTPTTVFDLASLTKPFTAAAIMLLVEDGKVCLDDPINRYLPGDSEHWTDISVRQLLTHTAGLKHAFWPEFEGYELVHYPTALLFEAASHLPLDFEPGERWQYSDQGYFLLGMIVEQASGKPYEEFLRERMFEPLGMSATFVLGQDPLAIVENRASSYTLLESELARFRVPYWTAELGSEGGLWSSIEDLALWAVAIDDGGLLRRASLDQMWTPVRLADGTCREYGFGWFLREFPGRKVVHHSGLSGVDLFRLPNDDLTLILLTNMDARLSRPFDLALELAARYVADLPSARPGPPVC